jgi:hypothetical protein
MAAAGNAAAAAAAAAVAPANAPVLRIAKFKGTETPSEVRQFVSEITTYAAVAHLNDNNAAAAAKHAMAGEALRWVEVQEKRQADIMANWTTMRVAFLARYVPAINSASKAALLKGLARGKAETIQNFADRCHEALFRFQEGWPVINGADLAPIHDSLMVTFFLAGLQPESLAKSMAGYPDLHTPDEVTAMAATLAAAEKRVPDRAGRAVEVAAVGANGARTPKRQTRGNRGGANRRQGRDTSQGSTERAASAERTNFKCNHCNKFGHGWRVCRARKAEKAAEGKHKGATGAQRKPRTVDANKEVDSDSSGKEAAFIEDLNGATMNAISFDQADFQ